MPEDFLPILILVVLSVGMSAIAIALSSVLGPRKSDPAKLTTYESGMVPVGDARLRFSVKFFLVAVLFILFDVEAIFLYPWAVLFVGAPTYLLIQICVFLGILSVGYFYVWRKGALEWD